MTYTKPQLFGYQAINVIQGIGKGQTPSETNVAFKTTPAYEADE